MWISVLLASVFVTHALGACESGWTLYEADNTCIKPYETRQSYSQARQTCQGQGADLVQVRDSDLSDFIGGLMDLAYWAGVWDENEDWTFAYLDGTPLSSYHPWRRGTPRQVRGNEFCVLVIGSSSFYKGQWNNQRCVYEYPFVCEKQN